jgi:hypothetical protein
MSGLILFDPENDTPALFGDGSDSLTLSSLLVQNVSITKSLTLGKPGDPRTAAQLLAAGVGLDVWVPTYLHSEVIISGGLNIAGDVDITGDLTVRGKILVTDVDATPGDPLAGDVEVVNDLTVGGTSTLVGNVQCGLALPASGKVVVGQEPAVGSANVGIVLQPDAQQGAIVTSGNLAVGTAPIGSTCLIFMGGKDSTGTDGGTTDFIVGNGASAADNTVTLNGLTLFSGTLQSSVGDSIGEPAVNGGATSGGDAAAMTSPSSDTFMQFTVTAAINAITAGDTIQLDFSSASTADTIMAWVSAADAAAGSFALPVVTTTTANDITLTWPVTGPTADANPVYNVFVSGVSS